MKKLLFSQTNRISFWTWGSWYPSFPWHPLKPRCSWLSISPLGTWVTLKLKENVLQDSSFPLLSQWYHRCDTFGPSGPGPPGLPLGPCSPLGPVSPRSPDGPLSPFKDNQDVKTELHKEVFLSWCAKTIKLSWLTLGPVAPTAPASPARP